MVWYNQSIRSYRFATQIYYYSAFHTQFSMSIILSQFYFLSLSTCNRNRILILQNAHRLSGTSKMTLVETRVESKGFYIEYATKLITNICVCGTNICSLQNLLFQLYKRQTHVRIQIKYLRCYVFFATFDSLLPSPVLQFRKCYLFDFSQLFM